MTNNIMVYLKLDGDEESLGTHKVDAINEQVFDVINSDMTRSRTLEDILWALPNFKQIIDQLKPGMKIVGIWCGDKNTEKDIKKLHPEVEIYGIDIKDTGPVPWVNFLQQNLLKNITLPPQTKIAYSFYTLQYLPNPLKTVQEVYNQLAVWWVAILHMWPLGIIDSEIGIYINKHNDPKKIFHFQPDPKDIDTTKYNLGDYIIVHKRKENTEPINMPLTKSYKLDKIGVKWTDGNVYTNINGDLMYHINIDTIKTDARDTNNRMQQSAR
jgi:hypothetical protein